MSESIVRKVQPFTIGTRLSVPAVPKCQEFTQSYLQSQSLDNCTLQHNLNSLYLSRSQVCAHGPCLVSPIVKQVVEHKQQDMAAEDHLNQNVASPSAVSRSIKKITISGSKDRPENKVSVGPAQLSITGSTSENNNNNNNVTSTSDPHLPRIVGVSCENKPSSHFKVLLRKDSSDEFQPTQEQTRVRLNGDRSVQQAEAWIKGKLQDLKDGCNIQRCPLQDWEEASQTLQRDLKDFENTLIQLNQMGEQLICKLNPTSDLVKKQLSQLRDQWQTLKQMAANQTRALGGAKNLQEFNKKVDKLEAWIKEKQEEEQSLVNVLGESVDKMQLTRRILDLKQDEQLYRNLHEEINHLALKLEKQGKTDGKNISSRRKHINKMWLKVQSHLKNYHENLQLALEVSSFYQQADNTLFAINNMRKSISASKELDSFGDREIRDIASQIMMLDVSVSQLSNLHPALAAGVTQKQSEVKDCWALLQKVFRSDRTTLSPTGSTFTREDADPLTLAREPQCNVGTETQRIMGKEVKEEQNRLKGCVSTVECGIGRRTQSHQSQEQQSVNHTSSPMGDGPVCANDVIVRYQLKGESRKPRAEPKLATAPRGHPQLHTQLQKFTVSADKTLSWLKDNVSMATQVCSVVSFEGLEAARRCQHALEQEILANRARIEVVKREGRGLVRAQHPGSAKIEEFLGQLEVLWEELRRRHQRNAVFLQASEELGFRVVKVLQALGSLEAWLESVELSMKESALAGDPETMSMAERESCLLEKEVAERSLELSALRQEVDRLHGHSHPHTRGLPARMEEVERKYHRVQNALTQQNSELQDTRMLTEFLERVELEESQEPSGSQYSLGQPLHSEISSAPTLLGLQSSGSGDPLIESMGDPVEELREAVEMLNDTVRERGRSQSHDQAIHELLSKHASLAVRVEECLCCSKELSLDILEKETDMAIQCEPDRCGLEALQEKQDHLEIDYEVIRGEVKEMENQASRLEELCPERVHVLGAKIQATLQGWAELGKSVTENKSRLQEFMQLQDFFRSYLAMISWTEDTRSCIFSATALHLGKDGQKPLAAELDMQIEQKFEEFDELVATGRNLLDKEHHLTQMVRERMEELRSMLGWILVHWRAQKQQWLHKTSRQELAQDNIYSEATMCSPLTEVSTYLHVKDNNLAVAPVYESITLPRQKSRSAASASPTFLPSSSTSPSSSASASQMANVTFHPLTGSGGSSSIFSSLKRMGKKRKRKRDARRHTIQKIMGVEEQTEGMPQYACETITYDTHTWPLKEGRRKKSSSKSGDGVEAMAYMKNPLLKDIDTECSGEYSIIPYAVSEGPTTLPAANHVRSHCRFLSLGSVLSFDLPKDMTLIPSIQDIITIAPPESKKGAGTDPDPLSQRHTALSSFKQTRPAPAATCSSADISFSETQTSVVVVKDVPNVDKSFQPPHISPELDEDQTVPCNDLSKTQFGLHEDAEQEWDKMSSEDKTGTAERVGTSQSSQLPIYVNQAQSTAEHKHGCPSVHTLIRDLNGHQYHRSARPQSVHEESPALQCLSQASHMVVNLKSTVSVSVRQDSVDSGISTSSSIKLCTDAPCPDNPQPKGVVGRLMSLEVGGIDCIKTRENAVTSSGPSTDSAEIETEPVHLDHQQFEEEEEELEDIWNQTTNYRQSICSDIMYQPNQEESDPSDQSREPRSRSPSPKTPAVLYRNLATASAPNLLVAEFRLPPYVQSLLGYDKEQSPKGPQPPLAIGDRRSWAAFPNREPASKASVTVNETASDPVKLPDVGDNQRYVYQYREDEEEEEGVEEAKVGEEVDEHTGCMKDQSMSLLSVHMGLDGVCQQRKASQSLDNMEKQEGSVATGGRCITLSGKPELQSMEGTLERKHKLQLGGKKAASRGWNSYHAVLYRHTLCFYQDRKDTLRSSACGLPLNLMGAECSPATEYTKKPNCFRLQLRDGSEYLLNACSRFMMKKWMMKIQANTGQSESLSSVPVDQDFPISIKPLCPGCHGLAKCHCSSRHDVTSTFPRRKPPGTTHTKGIVVLTREFTHMPQSHLRSVDEQSTVSSSDGGGCDDDEGSLKKTMTHRLSGASSINTSSSPHSSVSSGHDWLSNKRRSHSFTSATFQKIKPMLHTPGGGGLERGSNYCVTLVVGDKSSDSPSASRSSEPPLLALAGWQQDTYQDSALRSYASLPRPRNKSVFKKFFGKRDL
uniref:PH domain-containing protein n=1 Tax=Dicentrarchus labrax TaxID=13489 RepID=A0A8C4IKA7_DICLA